MRVLVIKTSSLGDVVHTLPALTDARRAYPDLVFDWVVEDAFAPIVERHPAVDRVIPCALRRWRRHPLRAWRSGEWPAFRRQLRERDYDAVIDAQGLMKSAFLVRRARGPAYGLDRNSAREPRSSRALDYPLEVPGGRHAVTRVRQIFARALDYAEPDSPPDYGLGRDEPGRAREPRQLIFIHGTTWPTKHWPLEHWQALARLATEAGFQVLLPWGSQVEHERARAIAEVSTSARVLPEMNLSQLLDQLVELDGFVAVDTGLAHLAAACDLPGVVLYGPTDPQLTGVTGRHATSLAADFPCSPCLQKQCTYRGELGRGVNPPCFSTLAPDHVWRALGERAGWPGCA
jgi:heptosyltransferase-1